MKKKTIKQILEQYSYDVVNNYMKYNNMESYPPTPYPEFIIDQAEAQIKVLVDEKRIEKILKKFIPYSAGYCIPDLKKSLKAYWEGL